ncbi:MAG: hypothetical protein ACOZNI_30765 [Myxococcota bacterium]
MRPYACQLTLRRRDGRPLARDTESRRALAREVLGRGRPHGLIAFRAAGDGLRALFAADSDAVCFWAHGLPWNVAAWVEPLRDGGAVRTAMRAIAVDDPDDPTWEASSLPDLAGMRVAGRYTRARVREFSPGVTPKAALDWMHVRVGTPVVDGARLADAAAAAVGLPDLRGESRLRWLAQRAAIEVADGELPDPELALALDLALPILRTMRGMPAHDAVVRAIRMQLAARPERPRERRAAAAGW